MLPMYAYSRVDASSSTSTTNAPTARVAAERRGLAVATTIAILALHTRTMRSAIVTCSISLAIACASQPSVDRHAAGTCDASWIANGFTICEAGCADSNKALLAQGPSCNGKTLAGVAVSCQRTFVFDGATGCCASDPPNLYFADCQ